MIRSTKHSLKFSNCNKLTRLKEFIDEYRRVACLFVDQIWNQGYKDFVPEQDKLLCPKYLDYNTFNIDTTLSARILRTLTTQICGILTGTTLKRRNVLFAFSKNAITQEQLNKSLRKYPLVKPDVSKIKPELNSLNCEFLAETKEFNGFIKLKSLGKKYGTILLPFKNTRISQKWANKGQKLNSVLLCDGSVIFRFSIKNKSKNTNEAVVGADQGLKTVLSLSNGCKTPEIDSHGYSLESITDKLSRKKKGSKSFRRAQEHRKNFVNWSINQLNLGQYKEIKLEKIWNIGYKKQKSRKLSHWCNTLIRDKIKSLGEELDVLITEQDSTYRSQRCSGCGITRKANRKGKIYECKHCGLKIDSDYNAAKNHEVNLPEIDWQLRGQKYNLGNGFYWKPEGLFLFDGREFTVSSFNKNKSP